VSTEALRAGISKVVLRQAAYYAAIGVGTYTPKGYGQFDTVVVKQQEPFEFAELLSHSCAIIRVEFWSAKQLIRYVDFALAVAGFSGKPVLHEVPKLEG